MVQGSLRSREYDKDGVSRRVSEVRAETIAKLDRVQRGEAQESPESCTMQENRADGAVLKETSILNGDETDKWRQPNALAKRQYYPMYCSCRFLV
jgi:hypothetical protein